MNTPAIEIRGLRKTLAKFALGPLDLTVPNGTIYGLIGPNGSGKSTTLDLIFGMGGRDEGTIRAAGFDHETQEQEMKQAVTYSSPETSFAAWGKVGLAIRYVRSFYPAWNEALCLRLMELFRLDPDEKIGTLSFGARTKLSLLLAMCPGPQVLVLDEPTTGLDPEARQILFNELLRMVQDENRTVLISSHQLSDLERFADHIGILSEGRLVCEGSTVDLVGRHRMVEYTQPPGGSLPVMPGFHVRRSQAGRSLAVVDLLMHPPASLEARGLNLHSQTELPLEDIFLAITSKQKEAA
jgi:ABC-2 type transport system ATP-binding protein